MQIYNFYEKQKVEYLLNLINHHYNTTFFIVLRFFKVNKTLVFLIIFFLNGLIYGQNQEDFSFVETVIIKNDSVFLDKKFINPIDLKILDEKNLNITNEFLIDYDEGLLVLKNKLYLEQTIQVFYNILPDFLTKTYTLYDSTKVVSTNAYGDKVYTFDSKPILPNKPFDGLETSGSISRGVTVGNNQNAVVNSNLDLQITGQLSDKIGIRASIQDSNIPIQSGGYSQRLDEFDQVFMEIFSDKWKIRGGDLFIENRQNQLLNFNKKVQGVMPIVKFGKPGNLTEIELAGAVVRGLYTKTEFVGKEGNQGPYKLIGPNGERFVLIISGSESVFVNGRLLQRGENNQYMIDYNAGEIIFTSLFPITSEMRIVIEYQYSERNFNRFITYGGAKHSREKFHFGAYFYSEADNKNQPLQQSLSPEQVEILKQAGDDLNAYFAPSAVRDTWSENKVLYRKVFIGAEEIFEFSNDPNDELYFVRFSNVGANNGNYRLVNNQTIGKIYEYVSPVSGIKQGDYEPKVRLVAPSKIQTLSLVGGYQPSEKTNVSFEWAMSDFDQNTFSNLDNDNNQGQAGIINWQQKLFKNQLETTAKYQFIQRDFKAIERLFNIEFNRDWQVFEPNGNQSFLQTGFNFINKKSTKKNDLTAFYGFEHLSFSENYNGQRHTLNSQFKSKRVQVLQTGSYMQNSSSRTDAKFLRHQINGLITYKKNWFKISHQMEDVQERLKENQTLSNISQRFNEMGAVIGRGDSTKVFISLGYTKRLNDSIKLNQLQRVNQSNNYFINTRLINKTNTQLSAYIQYRELIFNDTSQPKQPSLNSRLNYQDVFFKKFFQITTSYENLSGSIAQQEFTYLEVEAGLGVYMWNDYNQNGIQELEEFEIAPFPDLARYIRVFLPNQIFIATHQNRFNQVINIDPSSWINQKKIKKLLSKFYLQTSYQIDQRIKRDGNNFQLNPFNKSTNNLLGLNETIRFSLFFNRAKTKHSSVYTYIKNNLKNVLVTGSLTNKSLTHQWQYNHLINDNWRFSNQVKYSENMLIAENFSARDYNINNWGFMPKMSYLFSESSNVEVFFEMNNKNNQVQIDESLKQTKFGLNLALTSSKKFTLTSSFSYVNNLFSGNANSAVGFQMLEGLQAGKNLVWQMLLQKNITNFLDINLNYQGRKSEDVRAIHTGNIQLRAYF